MNPFSRRDWKRAARRAQQGEGGPGWKILTCTPNSITRFNTSPFSSTHLLDVMRRRPAIFVLGDPRKQGLRQLIKFRA